MNAVRFRGNRVEMRTPTGDQVAGAMPYAAEGQVGQDFSRRSVGGNGADKSPEERADGYGKGRGGLRSK